MRFYFSAKWDLKEIVETFQNYFTGKGHTLSADWTKRAFERDYEQFEQSSEFSEEEAQAILSSDVFVHLSDLIGKGKYVDLGIALAGNILERRPFGIYVIGEKANESQFYFNPRVKRIVVPKLFLKDLKPSKGRIIVTARRLEEEIMNQL